MSCLPVALYHMPRLDRGTGLTTTNSTQKNPDDIVITLAIRTPLAKGKKGGLKDTPLDGIVFKLLEQVVKRSKFDPALVEDVCLGNVSSQHLIVYASFQIHI